LTYRIEFTKDGLEDAKALPKSVKNSLAKQLKSKLATDPIGCSEQLREPLVGWRSFHYAKYRVIFRSYEDLKIIAIAAIGKHSSRATEDVYRKLETLARSGQLADGILATLLSFSDRKR
jgi:mRNA-degrading endonuclease RelE of RelBE toxin-antitoxin system